MNPMLLFDASCASCSRVAAAAKALADPLETRSLDDPELQDLLDELAPDRRREPMLLTSRGGRPRVLRGWRMRVELARLAGLGGSLELARALRAERHARPAGGEHAVDRRGLLMRGATAVGALVLARRVEGGPAPAFGRPALLAPDDPVVKRLRTGRSAHLAERTFGAPDWSSVAVRHAIDDDGALGAHSELHVVPLPSRGTQRTALVLAHPQSRAVRAAAMSSDAALMTEDVVVQTQGRAGHERVRWLTVDGRLILDRPLRGTGDTVVGPAAMAYRTALRGEASPAAVCSGATVSASGELAPASAQSCIDVRLFIQCFLDCIGRHVDEGCLESCVSCAQGQVLPGCVNCYFCAGPHARRCVRLCAA
jgi:hypothetical protein